MSGSLRGTRDWEAIPNRIVVWDSPVASDTAVIPPHPRATASLASEFRVFVRL